MSVAGWKKRKQMFWILLGAGPLLLCVLLLLLFQGHLRRELIYYRQKVEQKSYSTAYCLKNEKKAGQLIEESDLEQITLSAGAEQKLPVFRKEKLVGKVAKVDMKKGSIVSEMFLTKQEDAGEDMRICTYSEMEYSGDIREGCYADIRISFPNGEDYIVVRHKEVLAVSEEDCALTFCLGEAELLRLSSAFVDSRQYEDTKIYAIAYRDNLQEPSLITYPVNPQVYLLTGWDPNVLENDGVDGLESVSRGETELRQQLEEHLNDYRIAGAAEPETIAGEAQTEHTEQSESEMDEFFP